MKNNINFHLLLYFLLTFNVLNFKRIAFFVFFLFLSLFINGQVHNHYSVSGKLMDSTSGLPIEFASVAIYRMPDTVLVTGTISDSTGRFVLKNMASGRYLIKVSFVGYQTLLKTSEITNASIEFSEPFYLTNSTIALNEFQITGEQLEKQLTIEKTIINVSQNISSVSGNITDVLKSESSVTIDSENNVYLRGNKNILILLDGVPTTVSSLNSMSSSSIDNIEIITNPDAKFDAEGTGGIINIVTKRQNLSGFKGAASLNYGFNNRVNGGLGLSINKGIWDIGFNYNGKYEKTSVTSNLTRTLYNQNILIEQGVNSSQLNPSHQAALMLALKPNSKNIFSLSVKMLINEFFNIQNINGNQISDSLPEVFFLRKNDITFSRKTIESKFSYKKIFVRNKNELSFDASFSRTRGRRPAAYYIEDVFLQKSSGGGAPTNIALQIDYLKTVFNSGKVEFGLKGFSRWNSFNYKFFELDSISEQWNLIPAFSNDLEHQEYIYSFYLMYSDSLFKKIFYKLGARLEYNTSNLIQNSLNEKICNEYLSPFPYLLLKYNINRINSLSLSVNRRITRPAYPQLNPFVNVIDQMTYETGNKNLEPETLDKIELNYSFIKEKFQLRTNLYMSSTKEFITQVTLLSATDKLVLTYVNGTRQEKIGGDFDVTYKFSKYLSANLGYSVFHSSSTGQFNEINLATDDLAWVGNIKTIVKPDQKTEFQLFMNYNSPIDLPQFRLNEIFYADIALKRSFLSNKFTLSFTLTDVLNTINWKIQTQNAVYKLNNYSKSETRIFWIGLTFNFNSGKIQRSGENEIDNGLIKLGQ
ncbi:MAG: outer membrane beta-barrel protein [Bacteroidales bacterium]|nr:outer membrane beta-barrel protein [Bacteroidales bacterium]